MYCKHCGKEIADDSVFCQHCGTRQIPKKIVVEFKEPSLPSINQDTIRNSIFCIEKFLRKTAILLKPIVVRILIVALITSLSYCIPYYSYYYYNQPPEASVSEINLYREKGITSSEKERYLGMRYLGTYRDYKYENPSLILPNCKWDLDDDMMKSTSTWLKENRTNINESRENYLRYRSQEFAMSFLILAFFLCLLYYSAEMIVSFRKWLYKM